MSVYLYIFTDTVWWIQDNYTIKCVYKYVERVHNTHFNLIATFITMTFVITHKPLFYCSLRNCTCRWCSQVYMCFTGWMTSNCAHRCNWVTFIHLITFDLIFIKNEWKHGAHTHTNYFWIVLIYWTCHFNNRL